MDRNLFNFQKRKEKLSKDGNYPVYSTYQHPLFLFSLFFPFPFSFTFLPAREMWPQSFSPMLYRICTTAQENCKTCTGTGVWKNDLPFSVSICRPWTGDHPSKYWLSAKMLDWRDRLVPNTYHTPNAIGNYLVYNYFSRVIE